MYICRVMHKVLFSLSRIFSHDEALIYQKFTKFINSTSKHMSAIFKTKLNLYKHIHKIIYEHTYFTQ